MNTKKIGAFIAKKRHEKNMTQQDLAEKLLLTGKTISRWENGNYMPDLTILIELSNILETTVYELLLGEEISNKQQDNIETEIRFLYSLSEEEKIINYFKTFTELSYMGAYEEKTLQYNHPMKEYNFYSKEIDARFRLRITTGHNYKKTMITYKRRLENFLKEDINTEEEIEVEVTNQSTNNLIYLLENVLHMTLKESYTRTRHIFKNNDIEVAIDIYPFMIAIEIENKSTDKDPKAVILYYLNLFNFKLEESYRLSWDDKYDELCNEQSIKKENHVDKTKIMPTYYNHFFTKSK
jgi:transcriptional regulator with XRE-family HTH domain